jgi:hypothetical protein
VNTNSSLQFLNNTSLTRGKRSFRFGGEIRRHQFNQVGNQYGRGSFSFSITPTWDAATSSQGDAFASFLLGNVTLTEVAAQIASVQYRQTSFAVYFDDVRLVGIRQPAPPGDVGPLRPACRYWQEARHSQQIRERFAGRLATRFHRYLVIGIPGTRD